MLRYAVAWLSTAVVFVALDAVWLTNMGGWYRAALGDLMAPEFRLAPAAIFYVLFLVGLVVFAVAPALGEGRFATALVQGALFGFFTYATYDLTNQATLAHWPLKLTLVDLAWGATLSGASAALGYLIASAVLARISAP
ncbi:MAG: DUF2177 family protein [Parvibaculum sp.]|uniref:DUF2177 family protein n=1 Tax=Parvibaculum sp. TaxID=2024848 RepID=UPI0028485ABD|nr:DUF2177 family protein [Parvibaculum sp.]MDR3500537.1 DUF2177 family protein [Parvibaculum sp.]